MTHRTLNGLIAGLAVFFSSLIIAGILYGDADTANGDRKSDTVATENETPFSGDDASETTELTGVGGVEAEEWTATGVVIDAESEEPLAGVSVVAEDDGTAQVTTTTDDDGSFELEEIPATAMLVFSLNGYESVTKPANGDGVYSVALERGMIFGRVASSDGSPIQSATVARGDSYTRTVSGGEFHLDYVPEAGDVIAKAAGYETQILSWDEFNRGFTLAPKSIRGIYATAETVGDEDRFSEILGMIDRTELNALVLDVKDDRGILHYGSTAPLALESDAVQPLYDASEVLEQLQARGIHAVARISVFADPQLAQARPDLAILDEETGGLWESEGERSWANPYRSDVWDYNVQLMQEVADLGFDEIQLSYVQFPGEGPLDRADYGQDSTVESRQQAIAEFLDLAYDAIGPTPALLTADVTGMTLWDEIDEETGQNLTTMVERLDYLHPILFPSSFEAGSLGYEVPANHPYEMVFRSLESAVDHLPGHLHTRLRPWLQDFNPESGPRYGEGDIRAQIDAANARGVSGWMLWDPENFYHEAALRDP